MHRPHPALVLVSLLAALSACGKLRVVDVPQPEDTAREAPAPAPTARAVSDRSGSSWASQLALDACRAEIARRWRVSHSAVRASSRGHDTSDGTDLVNWDLSDGTSGFCRVDQRGTVLNVETERSSAPRPEVARSPTPPPALPSTPSQPPPRPADPADPDAEPEAPQVSLKQLEACRSTVVRETGARSDDVGLSAGTPDENGAVLIDWSLGTGRQGTCLVDSSNTVVQFKR